MLLSKRQRRGFSRLFHSLTLFVADEEGIEEPLQGSAAFREEQRMLGATVLIWNTEDGREWIDSYVDWNPDGLNRRDLAVVASWKDAVAGAFCVKGVGANTVFLTEDYAFVVRGIVAEIHDLMETPVLCWGALLPFDGVITFSWGLAAVANPDAALRSLKDRGLEWYRERGRIVRTERQYLKVAPLVPNKVCALMEDPGVEKAGGAGAAADASAVAGDPYEVVAGQHRGVLAGIWGEERDRLGLDETKARVGEMVSVPAVVRKHFSSKCMAGTPISSLADVLMTGTRDEIVKWAKWLRLVRYSHLRKAELARDVARFFVEDPKDVLDLLQAGGKQCVEGARRTFEAGGRLDVRLQDMTTFVDFPKPCFPVLNGYQMGDILVAHMPDEVREALGGVDWDAEVARADVIDRAAHYLEALVSYRGIVEVGEAFSILMTHPDYVDLMPDDLETLNVVVMNTELISCQFVRFSGDNEGVYVMDPLLMREAGIGNENMAIRGREFLPEEILEAQRGIEPRPLSGLKPGDDAMGFFLSPDTNPLAREIITYLDERVPDGGDDYNFAERVLEDTILMDWQHDFNPDRLHMALTFQGFEGTSAQMRHLEGLFARMFDVMPRWLNNGWSNAEVGAHRR